MFDRPVHCMCLLGKQCKLYFLVLKNKFPEGSSNSWSHWIAQTQVHMSQPGRHGRQTTPFCCRNIRQGKGNMKHRRYQIDMKLDMKSVGIDDRNKIRQNLNLKNAHMSKLQPEKKVLKNCRSPQHWKKSLWSRQRRTRALLTAARRRQDRNGPHSDPPQTPSTCLSSHCTRQQHGSKQKRM